MNRNLLSAPNVRHYRHGFERFSLACRECATNANGQRVNGTPDRSLEIHIAEIARATPARQGREQYSGGTAEEAERKAPTPRLAAAGGKPTCQKASGDPGERGHTEEE
jgi:hypothetical protein